ncbi:hypothetical protein [Acinetobacter sp. CFCC 10889]|uniref:hypothetical protein n=1 Tax=Acinetobacter sp. CFCC 10889 TaxID=1775557 RepID=UPI000DD0BC20|nr:hypothetical protein [Acinetobacter sp. CFCC 10889]
MTKYRQRAKKKKFDPNKIYLHHLRQQWMEQVAVEKQERMDHMFKTQYKQQFPLPLKGKPAYVMSSIIKYLILVFIVYTVVSLSILIGFDDAFIEKYWRILGSVILILPIFILLHRTIYTSQSKVIIQNFQIYPDTVAILFTDGSTEQIHYCDIDSVHMVSVGKTHHMEIRYTLTHKKELQDYPRMFELDFTFKKVFFLKNKYQMYSAFLQQLQIKNPSARIDTGSWYKSAFNMESFQLNERRLLIIKWSNILFWAIFVMTIFVVLFYPEYKHYFK